LSLIVVGGITDSPQLEPLRERIYPQELSLGASKIQSMQPMRSSLRNSVGIGAIHPSTSEIRLRPRKHLRGKGPGIMVGRPIGAAQKKTAPAVPAAQNGDTTRQPPTPEAAPKSQEPTPAVGKKPPVDPDAKKVKVKAGDTLTSIAKQHIEEKLKTCAKQPGPENDRRALLHKAFTDNKLTGPEAQIVAHEVSRLRKANKLDSDTIQVGQELVLPTKDCPELAKSLTGYAATLQLPTNVRSGEIKSGDTVSALVGKGLEQIQPNLSKLPAAAQKEIQDGYTKAFLAKNGIKDPNRVSEGQVFAQPEVSAELAGRMVQAEAEHALRTGTKTKEAFAKLTPDQQSSVVARHAETALSRLGRSAEEVVNNRLLGGWQANHTFAADRLPADSTTTRVPDVSTYTQGAPAKAVAKLGVRPEQAGDWMGLLLTASDPNRHMLPTKQHDLGEARKSVDAWVAALAAATQDQKQTIEAGRIPAELNPVYTAARRALETTIQYEPTWSLSAELPIEVVSKEAPRIPLNDWRGAHARQLARHRDHQSES
jgi:LysM repeat protein